MTVAVNFVLGVRTKNPLNGGIGNTKVALAIRSRERADARRKSFEATRAHLLASRVRPIDIVPCEVLLTRLSAGTMDTDGLAASQKAVRDGIADALGVNDGGAAIGWAYAQQKCPQGQYGVRVEIRRRS